jgi:uncharacterized damage-inducible protein DinB
MEGERMERAVIERYRRWFEYEQDAHAKVLSSLDMVPADRRDTDEYKKAIALFAHIVAARRMWLSRLGAAPAPPGALFPDQPGLGEVIAEWQSVRAQWSRYLAGADDDELARVFEYQSLDAGRFRSRVEDILAQLFGHSWYHRGQIAMLVRAAGGQPAVTDLVFWCREPVTGP